MLSPAVSDFDFKKSELKLRKHGTKLSLKLVNNDLCSGIHTHLMACFVPFCFPCSYSHPLVNYKYNKDLNVIKNLFKSYTSSTKHN